MFRLFLSFAVLGLGTAAAAAEPPPADTSLAHLLTPDEFAKAGLNKLTPAELAALESALMAHQQLPAAPATAAVPEKRKFSLFGHSAPPAAAGTKVISSQDKAASGFGAEQISPTKPADLTEELHSHIEGTFDGFSGRAAFTLENGQVWQQRNPETVSFPHKLVNPEVTITRGVFGYKMLIVPADRVVFVKRIQ